MDNNNKNQEYFWGYLNLDKIKEASSKIISDPKYGKSVPVKLIVSEDPDKYGFRSVLYISMGQGNKPVYIGNFKESTPYESNKANTPSQNEDGDLPF